MAETVAVTPAVADGARGFYSIVDAHVAAANATAYLL